MKKLMLLFALAGFFSLNMEAQTCSHAKADADKASIEKQAAEAAAVAATEDASIQARTSAATGQVSYVRTVMNTETGTTTFQEVEYCTRSGKFVNVSPSEKKACTAGKSSCAGATATGTKAAGCCSSGAQAGACCSGKSAEAKAAAPATDGEAVATPVANPEKKGGTF
ncbi:MAG: hypothetical protein KDC34_00705 [Saprospiraceae bacterium]|nr:hypothetical protein [Saprospiraceae bacterium]